MISSCTKYLYSDVHIVFFIIVDKHLLPRLLQKACEYHQNLLHSTAVQRVSNGFWQIEENVFSTKNMSRQILSLLAWTWRTNVQHILKFIQQCSTIHQQMYWIYWTDVCETQSFQVRWGCISPYMPVGSLRASHALLEFY